ncbi:MAG: hypothetical protein AABY93_16920 [Bacteroidota bacterium]
MKTHKKTLPNKWQKIRQTKIFGQTVSSLVIKLGALLVSNLDLMF